MKKTLEATAFLLLALLLAACAQDPTQTLDATEAPATLVPPTEVAPAAVEPTEPPAELPTDIPPTEVPAEVPAVEEPATAATPASEEAQTVVVEAAPLHQPRYIQPAYTTLGTRSNDGNPGPNYWQNTAVHNMTIDVAPPSTVISATQTIVYTNNSPAPLSTLPLRLYLNVRRPEAIREDEFTAADLTTGIQVDELLIGDQPVPWESIEAGVPLQTVKILPLPQPVPPGGSITLSFKWHYDLATNARKEGVVDPTTYFLAYFFPRVSVHNETEVGPFPGWDMEEYTYRSGRELNNDFADFTVNVNVPKNYLVWATGELQNPGEVLQPDFAAKLQSSLTSDEIINISQPEELQQGLVTAQTDTVTWTWKAEDVPDFALGLSDHYVWDAGSAVVDSATGRRTSVQSAYGAGFPEWDRLAQDGSEILSYISTEWPGVPFPYPKMTIFAGGANEEYPMMANDGIESPAGYSHRGVAAHEILHSYFPFAMGIDERRYPFMDEGWTTMFEYLFNVQDIGQQAADALHRAVRVDSLAAPYVGEDIPVIVEADAMRGSSVGRNGYDKPALGYLALKEYMGDEAFKASLHEFMSRWAGKRPLPWDMFNSFMDTSDKELQWLIQNWFFDSNYMDIAVEGVQLVDGVDEVTVKNVGGTAIPFDIVAYYADGTNETFHQGPGVWEASTAQAIIPIDGTSDSDVEGIVLATGIFKDSGAVDNSWGELPLFPSEAVAGLTFTALPAEATPGFTAVVPTGWAQPAPPALQFTGPNNQYVVVYQFVPNTTIEAIVPQLQIPDPAAALLETRQVGDQTWVIYRTVDANGFANHTALTEANGTVVALVVAMPAANQEADRTALLYPMLEQFKVGGS